MYLAWSLRRRLVWVDRKGRELGTLGEIGGYADVRISPDGRKVAVALRDPSHGRKRDVWVLDAARGTGVRVTAERTDEFDPAWFPDGDRIVYVSTGTVSTISSNGRRAAAPRRSWSGRARQAAPDDPRRRPASSHQHVTFGRVTSPVDPLALTIRTARLHLGSDSRFSEEHPAISPDGRWTAFDSVESGQREVYVQPVPDGPKRQVSVGGGQMPVWNRNGSSSSTPPGHGADVRRASRLRRRRLEPGEPQPLFPLQFDISGELPWHLQPYDVAPDGQRFLVIRRAPGVEPDGVVVVTNWTAMLGAR